jgi:hypothetical protein
MRRIFFAGRRRGRGETKTRPGSRVIGEVNSYERLPHYWGSGDDPGFTGQKGFSILSYKAPEFHGS